MNRTLHLLRRSVQWAVIVAAVLAGSMASPAVSRPQASTPWRSLLSFLLDGEPPEDPQEGGSRPVSTGDICWISPSSTTGTAQVWSDRPTLIWSGPRHAISQVVLTPSHRSDDERRYLIFDTLHRLDFPLPIYRVTLSAPLEAGVVYEWRMDQRTHRPEPPAPHLESHLRKESTGQRSLENPLPQFVPLQRLNAADRDRIAVALEQLEQEQRGLDDETARLQRARVFAQEGLWADAWSTVLDAPSFSPELQAAIADTLTALCAPALS
jgi:hypothetical protein